MIYDYLHNAHNMMVYMYLWDIFCELLPINLLHFGLYFWLTYLIAKSSFFPLWLCMVKPRVKPKCNTLHVRYTDHCWRTCPLKWPSPFKNPATVNVINKLNDSEWLLQTQSEWRIMNGLPYLINGSFILLTQLTFICWRMMTKY